MYEDEHSTQCDRLTIQRKMARPQRCRAKWKFVIKTKMNEFPVYLCGIHKNSIMGQDSDAHILYER